MPGRLIVDGMNVIGSRPDGWWRDRRGAQRALAQALSGLGEPVTVVFDGAPHDVDAPAGVEVVFVPHADDEIALRAAPGARVVTSDRALAQRVRAAGAEVLPAKAFRERVNPRRG
ncbi:MAG TPA: NYN domain-containing protein [Solirubrobacteraceae bacterium]